MSRPFRGRTALALVCLAAWAIFAQACTGAAAPPSLSEADEESVRALVTGFGERLKMVSRLAPEEVRLAEIDEAYAGFVTPELLQAWRARPDEAPGRAASSPWPQSIEIAAVRPIEDGSVAVDGDVVYVTSVEMVRGGAAAREPVTLTARKDAGGQWRISAYEAR